MSNAHETPASHENPTDDEGHAHHETPARSQGHRSRPYLMFWVMMGLSFVVMYAAMFTMIDGWGDFRNNLNMVYMTLTMWAPMGIVMLLAMWGMYKNTTLNVVMLAGLAALMVASFAATRTQTLIDDRQFIDSMVPHHSGAILMCREAPLTDPELRSLCDEIEAGQRREIEQMVKIRERLG